MNKGIFRFLVEKTNLNHHRAEQISNIKDINKDKAIQMYVISNEILKNGYDINPSVYERFMLKDLKALKNSVIRLFSEEKTIIDEEIIENISSSKSKTNINKKISEMSKDEKIAYLSNLYEEEENRITAILMIEPPEKKMEVLNKFIDEEIYDEENYLKKQTTVKADNILRELFLVESEKEQICKLRRIKEIENSNRKQTEPLYNKQLYDTLQDNKLSRDKQDLLKEAYFKKGIDIDEFKKNMGNEFYRCSEAQLENYVQLWDKYQDNMISRDDYYYGKNEVFKEDISQEEIQETLIPILQENTLSKKELDECIDSSIDRNDDFFEKVTELAITAKENNYSEADIHTLINSAENQSIDKIEEEIHILKEKQDNSIDVEKLKDISTDEIKIIEDKNLDYLNKETFDLSK